jgi:SMODS domain-containing protein
MLRPIKDKKQKDIAMGGSGGGYFRSDPEKIKKKLRDSEANTENAAYEAQVASLLSDLLANFNGRDHEATNRHLSEIKKAIEKDIDGTVDLLFGGSVEKHTYVDGLSDIDSLVILNDAELANETPNTVKKYFAEILKDRFPQTDIQVGKLAVTLKFSDAEVQLLPTVKSGEHLKVANRTGEGWSSIRPKAFSEKLTGVNQNAGRKVVPVIKLTKVIISNLPEKHQISGYHAESIAVTAFKTYSGDVKPKEMLKHFFSEASKMVKQPIRDNTGQSVHVDDSLGSANSLERRIVSDAFDRVHRRMKNADNFGSVAEWQKLFK